MKGIKKELASLLKEQGAEGAEADVDRLIRQEQGKASREHRRALTDAMCALPTMFGEKRSRLHSTTAAAAGDDDDEDDESRVVSWEMRPLPSYSVRSDLCFVGWAPIRSSNQQRSTRVERILAELTRGTADDETQQQADLVGTPTSIDGPSTDGGQAGAAELMRVDEELNVHYTEAEYATLCLDVEAQPPATEGGHTFSRRETDLLFALIDRLGCNYHVVYDRLKVRYLSSSTTTTSSSNGGGGGLPHPASLRYEDVVFRHLSVCRRVLQHRRMLVSISGEAPSMTTASQAVRQCILDVCDSHPYLRSTWFTDYAAEVARARALETQLEAAGSADVEGDAGRAAVAEAVAELDVQSRRVSEVLTRDVTADMDSIVCRTQEAVARARNEVRTGVHSTYREVVMVSLSNKAPSHIRLMEGILDKRLEKSVLSSSDAVVGALEQVRLQAARNDVAFKALRRCKVATITAAKVATDLSEVDVNMS